MEQRAVTPVFRGLRAGLHALFVMLTALVVVRAFLVPDERSLAAIGLSLLFLLTYGVGALLAGSTDHSGSRGRVSRRLRLLFWVAALLTEWGVLLWLTPEAAYLVFPLFFLMLYLLGSRVGVLAVFGLTIVATVALGGHNGWTIGGVVGPIVGACVAILIGLGYQAIVRETAERELLMKELIATRDQLAATEHESGILAERARLAREIHDTLAQGLSSIQLLLHAAERAAPNTDASPHITLARETAAVNLTEARRFIRELAPPALDDHGLEGALNRLAATQWSGQGLEVRVHVADTDGLPMHVQSALLRIVQGAIANVLQHARASVATIELDVTDDGVELGVTDDGVGFAPGSEARQRHDGSGSFGLQATAERVEQLGGTLSIDSTPGHGTTMLVRLSQWETP